MAKKQVIEFCGAFTGRAKKQDNETVEQFADRVERALNEVMDRYAKRFNVNIGVDYGDIRGRGDATP